MPLYLTMLEGQLAACKEKILALFGNMPVSVEGPGACAWESALSEQLVRVLPNAPLPSSVSFPLHDTGRVGCCGEEDRRSRRQSRSDTLVR